MVALYGGAPLQRRPVLQLLAAFPSVPHALLTFYQSTYLPACPFDTACFTQGVYVLFDSDFRWLSRLPTIASAGGDPVREQEVKAAAMAQLYLPCGIIRGEPRCCDRGRDAALEAAAMAHLHPSFWYPCCPVGKSAQHVGICLDSSSRCYSCRRSCDFGWWPLISCFPVALALPDLT